MNYRPSGMKLWDTWYLNHNGEVHAFYMQGLAPNSARSAKEAAGLGHAVSKNLLDWEELPVAIVPGEPGSGEDMNYFTGCAFEKDNTCHLFYTCRGSEDEGRTQTIALATSGDFLHFEKHPENPVLTPDPSFLCTSEAPAQNGIVDCRDLIVVDDPEGEGYVGFYASRRPSVEMPGGAVIVCVRSKDLVHWTHEGIVFSTDRHTIIELPDVFCLDGRWYMTLLVNNDYGSRDLFSEQELVGGTVYVVSDTLTGVYHEEPDNIILASRSYNGITCRSVDFQGKKYLLYVMTERKEAREDGGPDLGRLSSPKEYRVVNGKLRATYAELLEQKLGENLATPEALANPTADCQVLYWTPGDWKVEDARVTGRTETCWSRYQLPPWQDKAFSYSATIRMERGAAAGLVFRQSDGYSGYGVLLDYKWQKLLLCRLPRMEVVDARQVELELGREYHLRVLCYGIHYEVYLDDVLLLQTITYTSNGGRVGLFVDRGEAVFDQIALQPMEVDEPGLINTER